VFVSLRFEDGTIERNRIAPFALAAGVVIEPWLPDEQAWITHAMGKPTRRVTRMRFESADESAFQPRIAYGIERAPDLSPPALEPAIRRELVLGAAGDLPLSYESAEEPESLTWTGHGLTLLCKAPSQLVFAAEPGRVRLSAHLFVPPWIAASPDFTAIRVRVVAREGGVAREVTKARLPSEGDTAAEPHLFLRVEERFAAAGELVIQLFPAPGCDPSLAHLAIENLRLRTVPE